ncbi:MAG: sugar-binding transcriptional regulator [Anaerolineae bacterium]
MDRREARVAYLAEVASKYYDQNKSQQEIAEELGITRSAVSRLLTEARDRGIVEIIVHYPWRTSTDLERALLDLFPLKAVRVLVRGNKSYDEMVIGLGVLGAQYFSSVLKQGNVVGISWGSALYQLVRALRPASYPESEVVQLVGAVGTERSSAMGPLLAPLLANQIGAPCRYLHAPLLTESEAARDALLNDRSIRETLDAAAHANIALVGIGTTAPERYNPARHGYVNLDELAAIRAAGAVGLIVGQHYDRNGEVLDLSINRRVVGISPDNLKRMPTIIGLGGDALKGEAILGALRGGWVNVLITDEQAARRVLQLASPVAR